MFRDTRTIDPPIADPVYRTVQGTDVAEAAFEYKLVEFVDAVQADLDWCEELGKGNVDLDDDADALIAVYQQRATDAQVQRATQFLNKEYDGLVDELNDDAFWTKANIETWRPLINKRGDH